MEVKMLKHWIQWAQQPAGRKNADMGSWVWGPERPGPPPTGGTPALKHSAHTSGPPFGTAPIRSAPTPFLGTYTLEGTIFTPQLSASHSRSHQDKAPVPQAPHCPVKGTGSGLPAHEPHPGQGQAPPAGPGPSDCLSCSWWAQAKESSHPGSRETRVHLHIWPKSDHAWGWPSCWEHDQSPRCPQPVLQSEHNGPRGPAQRSHMPRASQWPHLPGQGPTHSACPPGPDITRPWLLPDPLLLILSLLQGRSCTKHTSLTSPSLQEHDPEGQGAPLLSPLRAGGGTSVTGGAVKAPYGSALDQSGGRSSWGPRLTGCCQSPIHLLIVSVTHCFTIGFTISFTVISCDETWHVAFSTSRSDSSAVLRFPRRKAVHYTHSETTALRWPAGASAHSAGCLSYAYLGLTGALLHAAPKHSPDPLILSVCRLWPISSC